MYLLQSLEGAPQTETKDEMRHHMANVCYALPARILDRS